MTSIINRLCWGFFNLLFINLNLALLIIVVVLCKLFSDVHTVVTNFMTENLTETYTQNSHTHVNSR